MLGKQVLTLYPCKDYHEYLKGHYSNDCTRNPSKAEVHLSNPRFFNLRVFLSGKWIGNIYMLDYTSTIGAVILDRIQIGSAADLVPADLFPQLMPHLVAKVTGPGGFRLLGPAAVSNLGPIQLSYSRCRRRASKVRIRPSKDDRSFECMRDGILYVLSEPGSRECRPEESDSAPTQRRIRTAEV